MDTNAAEFMAISLVMLTGAVVVLRLTFAIARRLESRGKPPAIPSDLTTRLERIEQSIDSVAIEVERISEGQRFTTKVLSERSSRLPDAR